MVQAVYFFFRTCYHDSIMEQPREKEMAKNVDNRDIILYVQAQIKTLKRYYGVGKIDLKTLQCTVKYLEHVAEYAALLPSITPDEDHA